MQTDYIVVGAGSAGCVLSRVLAEAGHSVLLLEAGPQETPAAVRRPACYPQLFGSTLDWGFRTQRQAELAGRVVLQPRGRGPGGCTLLNAMIWMPPRPADRVRLAAAAGPDWCSDSFDRAIQTVESWVRPESPRWLSMASEKFLQAARGVIDAFPYSRMNDRGHRRTAADVLQESAAMSRVVRRVALVERLEIRDQRVVGVHWQSDASRHEQTTARRGVIVTTGTFQSPAILMRSGIGPAPALQACGIEVRRPCEAVGAQLVDHLVMPVVFSTPDPQPFRLPCSPRDVARWQTLGSGPLASNLAEVGGFADLAVASRHAPATVQLHVTPTHYLRYPHDNDAANASMTIAVTDSQPASRGCVRIESRDPAAAPSIDPGYLTDSSDLDVLVAGVRMVRTLAERAPLSRWCLEETLPSRRRDDEDALRKAVRRFAQTLYHPVGTCSLGQTLDSVVDPQLQLRGFDACWVVDASVLPSLPTANPNAMVMALAYRFARQIVSS